MSAWEARVGVLLWAAALGAGCGGEPRAPAEAPARRGQRSEERRDGPGEQPREPPRADQSEAAALRPPRGAPTAHGLVVTGTSIDFRHDGEEERSVPWAGAPVTPG